MNSYKNFVSDVHKIFKHCLTNYIYEIKEEDLSSVKFALEKCDILVSLGRIRANVFVFEKETDFIDNKFYDLRNLLEYQGVEVIDKESLLDDDFKEKIKKDLIHVLSLMLRYCVDILSKGDFTWKEDFDIFIEKRAKERWGDRYKKMN